MEVLFQLFLTLVLDGGEGYTVCPSVFTPGESGYPVYSNVSGH